MKKWSNLSTKVMARKRKRKKWKKMPYEYKKSDFKYRNIQHRWGDHATSTFYRLSPNYGLPTNQAPSPPMKWCGISSAGKRRAWLTQTTTTAKIQFHVEHWAVYMTDLSRTAGQPDAEQNCRIVTNLVYDSDNYAALSYKAKYFQNLSNLPISDKRVLKAH